MRASLSGRLASAQDQGMDETALPADLERFVAEAVAAGRYRDRDALIAAGVSLLREAEAELAAFVRSLEEAQAEAERDDWVSLEEMMAETDAIIAEKRAGY
jgi:putative addiction module CopG family antidote